MHCFFSEWPDPVTSLSASARPLPPAALSSRWVAPESAELTVLESCFSLTRTHCPCLPWVPFLPATSELWTPSGTWREKEQGAFPVGPPAPSWHATCSSPPSPPESTLLILLLCWPLCPWLHQRAATRHCLYPIHTEMQKFYFTVLKTEQPYTHI